MEFLYAYLVIVNAAGFLLMLIDKRRAVRREWRIPEAALMGMAIIGGSVGSLAGMYIFRHKTRHLKFTSGIPAILVLQALLAVWLLNR